MFKLINTIPLSIAAVAVLMTSVQVQANSAPYSYTKYDSVLDDSKLQAPDSDTVAIAQGEFEGAYNDYFYIPSSGNKWMTFQIGPDVKMRSELRQMDDWYTSSSTYHKMIGQVLLLEKGTVDEVTLMQVHDDSEINKPLVRIVWYESQKETGASSTTTDAYFAVVKTGTCSSDTCSDYIKYKLADYSETSTVKFEIKIVDNELTIKTNGVTNSHFDGYDVSYWADYPSYFKAGAYLQSDTDPDVQVQFYTLKYYEE